jgi:hypothetical protein
MSTTKTPVALPLHTQSKANGAFCSYCTLDSWQMDSAQL